jgi:hypothetical protein
LPGAEEGIVVWCGGRVSSVTAPYSPIYCVA